MSNKSDNLTTIDQAEENDRVYFDGEWYRYDGCYCGANEVDLHVIKNHRRQLRLPSYTEVIIYKS